jgi:hypothetical protein
MRELKFIHITKTAGTSIEDVAKEAGINWGRFHQEYGWWHELPSRKNRALLQKYDWFMVVRNPYSRIVSEFHCQWGGVGDDVHKYDRDGFNQYIQNAIKTRANRPRGDHYTPQYLYRIGVPGLNILKFEDLQTDFSELMTRYNMKISLNKYNNTSKARKKFGVNDLGPNSIRLINKVYMQDFNLFEYDTI